MSISLFYERMNKVSQLFIDFSIEKFREVYQTNPEANLDELTKSMSEFCYWVLAEYNQDKILHNVRLSYQRDDKEYHEYLCRTHKVSKDKTGNFQFTKRVIKRRPDYSLLRSQVNLHIRNNLLQNLDHGNRSIVKLDDYLRSVCGFTEDETSADIYQIHNRLKR